MASAVAVNESVVRYSGRTGKTGVSTVNDNRQYSRRKPRRIDIGNSAANGDTTPADAFSRRTAISPLLLGTITICLIGYARYNLTFALSLAATQLSAMTVLQFVALKILIRPSKSGKVISPLATVRGIRRATFWITFSYACLA